MNLIRKISVLLAGVIACSVLVGCSTSSVPTDNGQTAVSGSAMAVSVLNDAQKYNDFDVKVNFTADSTLEAAMMTAIDDDMLKAGDGSKIAALLGLDNVVNETDIFGVKASDDSSIKAGDQVVVYVFDDSSAKGMTDEAWLKSVASATNANYGYLKEELEGNQVTDVDGTYDVEWHFTYSGKTAMVKDVDEDGNVTRYVVAIFTCTTSATKTLAD